jgi:hypothetical protein
MLLGLRRRSIVLASGFPSGQVALTRRPQWVAAVRIVILPLTGFLHRLPVLRHLHLNALDHSTVSESLLCGHR